VYHISGSSQDPVGGAARFVSLANYYRDAPEFASLPSLLTFFSGDSFNPSLEGSVTKGQHMVPILNKIKTDIACLGNHDLDFGVEQFMYLAKQCEFPWLCANVVDPAVGGPIGKLKGTHLLESNGVKIGVIGLVERCVVKWSMFLRKSYADDRGTENGWIQSTHYHLIFNTPMLLRQQSS